MIYLADVNVLLALAAESHVHHASAVAWADGVRHEPIALCRVTQMGFLRLLTNERVMGPEVQSGAAAWRTFDALRRDSRVRFLPEPPSLEPDWRAMTLHHRPGANFWTNAYLSAFCRAANCTLVTFDKALARFKGLDVRVLTGRDST